MELDEILFGKLVKFLKHRRLQRERADLTKVTLSEVRPRLTILARIFTGKPIEIFPAENEGGYKDFNFFLPASFASFPSFEDNLSFYIYRVVYLSIQQSLNLNWSENDKLYSLSESRAKAIEMAPGILRTLELEYPLVYQMYRKLLEEYLGDKKNPINYSWFYGKWMTNEGLKEEVDVHTGRLGQKGDDLATPEDLTTVKARAIEEIKSITVDTKQQEDYVLNHNFEKVETAEEFSGSWRDFDGDDDMEEHQDALDELSFQFTVRVDDPVHSVYQAEFIENTSVHESSNSDEIISAISYPEWNYSKKEYRPDYCKLYSEHQLATDSAYYFQTVKEFQSILMGLRKQLTSINNKWQMLRRQSEGSAFDLDALTDLYADVHARHTPSDKIYLESRKRNKDLSILILVDCSLSSDSYVLGQRVIDVEKQVCILFGDILQEYETDFSVATFYSKTRSYTSYNILKDFDENWLRARFKIGAAKPNGYTRIGAALRHAGAVLSSRDSTNKWLILLSDGKPNDYDRYEGKYGVQDVKQALRELRQINVNSYALAIEAQARYYLPQMFGANHYQILHTPAAMINSMVHLFEKIRHQN